MLEYVLREPRARFLAWGDRPVPAARARRFEGLVAERASGVPIAYLTGEAWFFGRRFTVSRDVLVPRPETENMVEAVLDELRSRKGARLRLADVGTGSGAIAVTLAAECARAEVVATDISRAALSIARRNARMHGVAERLRTVHCDLVAFPRPEPRFEVLVANLPYVPTAAIPSAPSGVAFEPALAVDGGADGLLPYRRLLAQVAGVVTPGAALFMEAAPPGIEHLAEMAEATLAGAHVEIVDDYAGLERFVVVTLA